MIPRASADRSELQRRFERATATPMLLLSLVFLVVILLPAVVTVPARFESGLSAVEWLIWGAFAAELVANLYLAPKRLRFLRSHWFDVVIVAVPILRPLRLARSTRLLRVLRGTRIMAAAFRFTHVLRIVLTKKGLHYVLLVGLVLIVAASVAVTRFESGGSGSITDLQTALWWAVSTVTTVGYGDAYPITPEGRGLAVLLMLVGVATFGALTASITSYFVSESDEKVEVSLEDILAEVRRLEARIEELSERLTN